MKNKYIELLIRSAKLHHRNARTRRFQNGIVIRHLYDKECPEKYSWWDDVVFVLNDYLVNVAWQHPRHVYKDKVEELAYDACVHLKKPRTSDLFDHARRIGNISGLQVARSIHAVMQDTNDGNA